MDNVIASDQKRLMRRYLVWCYKTTKEDLDRIDRYFTQNTVDDFLLARLIESDEFRSANGHHDFKKKVHSFEDYKIEKLRKARESKFSDGETLRPEYMYLSKRLDAICAAIEHFLGKKELTVITEIYEQEMTARILSAREHS